MNLILLEDSDFQADSSFVVLKDRRAKHVRDVHRAEVGQTLRVGKINGLMGSGRIVALNEDLSIEIEVTLNEKPPAALPLTLYLALPRPKFIARVLQAVTSMGVKKIYVFNSYKVDKVYWSCQQITADEVRESCLLGLEQARDTVLPTIEFRKLFKPFVEDEMPDLIRGTKAFVAHPGVSESCPFNPSGNISLAVGPEGGFIDYEIQKLEAAGFQCVRTLERILKVETAVTSLIGRLVE